VIFVEHRPAPPLDRFIRVLWYAAAPQLDHAHERILPTGCVQVILNLERDFLHDCPEGEAERRMPPSLIVGARSIYEIVNTADMGELIGIVFEPGGFGPFARDAVDLFSNRSVFLEDVCGGPARGLRDRLRESSSVREKFRCLEEFLLERFAGDRIRHGLSRRATVEFALNTLRQAPAIATVRELARSTGWSERRFSQVFREEVGFSPKVWTRIQRFQLAVRQLHAGADLPWAELALDCGYYDQSHFANEFKAFSGVDATYYSASRTRWANHIPVN
jgi:AraC-like DNA-binding protein